MQLNFNELRELIAALNQTDIAELTLKSADFELTVRKSSLMGEGEVATVPSPLATRLVMTPQPASAVAETPIATQTTQTPSPPADTNWVEIKSPMVGTFYRSPAPSEASFVQVGDRISAGQVVCIVEAMKLMNEIEAEVSGQVMEILVENGQPVDFDKPLMRIQPD